MKISRAEKETDISNKTLYCLFLCLILLCVDKSFFFFSFILWFYTRNVLERISSTRVQTFIIDKNNIIRF